jgi:hypothetical protein
VTRLAALALALVATTHGALSRADEATSAPPRSRLWSGPSALTVPRGRWEFGLLGGAHHGLTDSLELSLHPVLVFALPHLEAKLMAARDRRHVLGLRARVSYPTTFLSLVSKEGSFGLLPATTEPPFAIELEADAIASSEWFDDQLVSVWLGGAVAVHEPFTPMELPLLDFPFLYQRFAPLYGPGVPRVGFSFEGIVVGGLHYAAELVAYLMPGLPDVENAYALENGIDLEYRFGEHVALSAGLRTSHARYPVGERTHFLPYFDVRTGF